MATAAGIIITTGAITLANDALSAPYVQGATPVIKYINWRVIPATAIAALIFAGFEKLNPSLARGMAYVGLVTALIHPMGAGPSPITHLVEIVSDSVSTISGGNTQKLNGGEDKIARGA